MKETKTLFISLSDEGGNKKNIAIQNPKDGLSSTEVKSVADIIINNDLISGKVGHLKTYNGAYLVTRRQEAV